MNPVSLLEDLQRTLGRGPSTLDQLWVEHTPQWQRLGWNRDQVSLWLACQPSLKQYTPATGEKTYKLDIAVSGPRRSLADELVALLNQAGRPMPLGQLIGKLPAGVVVTEPMLRAAAMQDARLELKGPLVKLA